MLSTERLLGSVGRLAKIVHGARLPEETWEGVADGSPLPHKFYKAFTRYHMRPRWQQGWAQLHWRGMEEKDPNSLTGHSVHCDLRLRWGRAELVQWVLTGKEAKLLRALRGKDDPALGRVQSALAVVKPAAFEAGARIEGKRFRKAEYTCGALVCVLGSGPFPDLEDALMAQNIAVSLLTAENAEAIAMQIARGETPAFLKGGSRPSLPMRGYWIPPGDPANLGGRGKTWQYLQTIDIFEWYPGFQRRDVHEIFVRKAKHGVIPTGRYILRALAGGRPRAKPGDPKAKLTVYWLFMRPPDQKAGDPSYHKDNGAVIPIQVWRVRRAKKAVIQEV